MTEAHFYIFYGRQCFFQFGFQAGDKSLIHHVVDDLAGGIKRASLLAGCCAGFGVVGSKEILKYLARQFRIERDFFFNRRIFGDGELVMVERMNETANLDFLELGVAVVVAQVHLALRAKE